VQRQPRPHLAAAIAPDYFSQKTGQTRFLIGQQPPLQSLFWALVAEVSRKGERGGGECWISLFQTPLLRVEFFEYMMLNSDAR
jgi:hypothetical protein